MFTMHDAFITFIPALFMIGHQKHSQLYLDVQFRWLNSIVGFHII